MQLEATATMGRSETEIRQISAELSDNNNQESAIQHKQKSASISSLFMRGRQLCVPVKL
jgi:hypothetical protein